MPWSPAPWEALGRAQLGAGQAADARHSFRKAISMDGGDWELWYRLAAASSGRARHEALLEASALFPRAKFFGASSSQDKAQP
jgi:Flp pilus assembly protein TadD